MIGIGDYIPTSEEINAIKTVIESGRISEGKYTREFEKRWSEYIGKKYTVACNSGTSALMLALTAMRMKYRKGYVLTTALSYVATSNAIITSGLSALFVDIDSTTFGITAENVMAALNRYHYKDIVGILPVHLFGIKCDIDKIKEIADKKGLWLIEDCSQAHGTVGTAKHGICSTYSFYCAHNIQAGELGAIVSDNESLVSIMRKLKSNGRSCACNVCTRKNGTCPDNKSRFNHELIGYNFRTNEFATAIANEQLKKANYIFSEREKNVKYFISMLSDIKKIQLPSHVDGTSYMAFPIICKGIDRDEVCRKIESMGVETRPIFGSIPLQPAYNIYNAETPTADSIAKNGFYVGCHQYLTDDDKVKIINSIRSACE